MSSVLNLVNLEQIVEKNYMSKTHQFGAHFGLVYFLLKDFFSNQFLGSILIAMRKYSLR